MTTGPIKVSAVTPVIEIRICLPIALLTNHLERQYGELSVSLKGLTHFPIWWGAAPSREGIVLQ